MKNFTQKFLAPGLLALSLVTASGAAMADPCTSCGVVTGTHTEEYKGKATALGTVGGAVVGGDLWIDFQGKPSESRLLSVLTTKRLGIGTTRNANTVNGLAKMLG